MKHVHAVAAGWFSRPRHRQVVATGPLAPDAEPEVPEAAVPTPGLLCANALAATDEPSVRLVVAPDAVPAFEPGMQLVEFASPDPTPVDGCMDGTAPAGVPSPVPVAFGLTPAAGFGPAIGAGDVAPLVVPEAAGLETPDCPPDAPPAPPPLLPPPPPEL